MIFGAGLNDVIGHFAALRGGNIGNEHILGPSYIFLVLQFFVDALPHVLNDNYVGRCENTHRKRGHHNR